MSTPGADLGSQVLNGPVDEPSGPTTPAALLESQETLPSTEAPASPNETAGLLKADRVDERPQSAVIPSSLTPPPSSQLPNVNGGATHTDLPNPTRASILSPPDTSLPSSRRPQNVAPPFAPPAPDEVIEASPDQLRLMVERLIVENRRVNAEVASLKMQVHMSDFHRAEAAKRHKVEQEMLCREVEALRSAEHARQARRELSSVSDSFQAKHYQLKVAHDELIDEHAIVRKRLKAAKKLIQAKEEEIENLKDDKEELLIRLRENRDHLNAFRSPGGIFHGGITPKAQGATSPTQPRHTPRQNSKAPRREQRAAQNHNEAPFTMLLEVLNAENNSAPSTPTTAARPMPKISSKHTRNVQSMSSLPITPATRPRAEYGGLLPSADLVPQSEPPHRYGGNRLQLVPSTPVRDNGRKSRESTISVDDNAELARQALASVAAQAQSFAASHAAAAAAAGSGSFHRIGDPHPSTQGEQDEEEVYESQASQAASEMLRRDPRESFEVVASRDGTPNPPSAPAEKSATLQQTLFAGIGRSGVAMATEKRKFSGGANDAQRQEMTSPHKRARIDGNLREGGVGLGIYDQDA
ncbi:hypothetical protein MCOR25_003593 [Pyricularia grisea]|uniref:FAD-dependent oxidoreductase-like enzyme n=1 Tax=Pyricularia grisea TaxID=148305 RepID=A0A6P8AR24_PYRGI|nr:uncharacterized protein PgNI_12001 [Pyricularia grisea]KAI6372909.1 hypothetical protein MCOR25_003593 [Pyricularia grisea]TLD04515.1 hypothetical protein PgNI_12001 [Pyricularia grisea]